MVRICRRIAIGRRNVLRLAVNAWRCGRVSIRYWSSAWSSTAQKLLLTSGVFLVCLKCGCSGFYQGIFNGSSNFHRENGSSIY